LPQGPEDDDNILTKATVVTRTAFLYVLKPSRILKCEWPLHDVHTARTKWISSDVPVHIDYLCITIEQEKNKNIRIPILKKYCRHSAGYILRYRNRLSAQSCSK